MSARLTIQRPRINPDGTPVLGDDGEPVTDPAVVDRRIQLKIGDEVTIEDWDWSDVPFNEAAAMEAAFGGIFNDFRKAISAGSLTALQILVWTVLKRTNPALRLADVAVPIGSVDTQIIDTDVEVDPTEGGEAGTPSPSPSSESSTKRPSRSTTASSRGSGND